MDVHLDAERARLVVQKGQQIDLEFDPKELAVKDVFDGAVEDDLVFFGFAVRAERGQGSYCRFRVRENTPQPSSSTPMTTRAPELCVPRRASLPVAPPMIMTNPMMIFHMVFLSMVRLRL